MIHMLGIGLEIKSFGLYNPLEENASGRLIER
jgi:hypothetical protein